MSLIFPWRGKDKKEKTPSDDIRAQKIEDALDNYLSNQTRSFHELCINFTTIVNYGVCNEK